MYAKPPKNPSYRHAGYTVLKSGLSAIYFSSSAPIPPPCRYPTYHIQNDKKCPSAIRKENNTRPLSFASEKELKEIIQILPGSVSPLGILNDTENKVKVFIDKEFVEKTYIIGIHPNDNTATIWLKTQDLINIIKEHGNKVELVEIKEVN